MAEQRLVNFANDKLPLERDNYAFCQVSTAEIMLRMLRTSNRYDEAVSSSRFETVCYVSFSDISVQWKKVLVHSIGIPHGSGWIFQYRVLCCSGFASIWYGIVWIFMHFCQGLWNFKVFSLLKLCILYFTVGVCGYLDTEKRLSLTKWVCNQGTQRYCIRTRKGSIWEVTRQLTLPSVPVTVCAPPTFSVHPL